MNLSFRLAYRALHQAQVPGRSGSPAQTAQHVEEVLALPRQGRLKAPATFGHMRLQSLRSSGVPMGLPEWKRLGIVTLGLNSPWSGC